MRVWAESAHVFKAEAWQRLKALSYLKNALGTLQVDRDELRDAPLGHGDAEQAVHAGHGDRVVGDDDEAGLGLRAAISSSRSQKRSTLASSRGASTSSSTQIGEGLARNTAKISAVAVSACSPPEIRLMVCGFLPGGRA